MVIVDVSSSKLLRASVHEDWLASKVHLRLSDQANIFTHI
jgi:hypothetical protein